MKQMLHDKSAAHLDGKTVDKGVTIKYRLQSLLFDPGSAEQRRGRLQQRPDPVAVQGEEARPSSGSGAGLPTEHPNLNAVPQAPAIPTMSNLAGLQVNLAEHEDSLNTACEYLAHLLDNASSLKTKAFLEEQVATTKKLRPVRRQRFDGGYLLLQEGLRLMYRCARHSVPAPPADEVQQQTSEIKAWS